MPEKRTRAGRRPGGQSSRAEILRAAKALFSECGYEATTLRAIAAEARVDSAMIVHFYRTKEGVFAAILDQLSEALPAMSPGSRFGEGGLDATKLARSYLTFWESPETGPAVRALARGALGSPNATAVMREFLRSRVFTTSATPGTELASATLLGVAVTRHLVRVGPLADMPLEALIEHVTPVLRRELDKATRAPERTA